MYKSSKSMIALILIIVVAMMLSTTVFADVIQLSEFAGAGDPSYKDSENVKATFNQPYGIALDKDGGIIVVDSVNNRIRKIKDGKVTTIAGFSDRTDTYGFPQGGFADGDVLKAKFKKPRGAVVDSKGNIFITDTGNNAIRKITGGKVYTFAGKDKGYANGKGIAAKFSDPSGITIDSSDNLYVADTQNQVIRKITPTGDVTTFAGVNSTDGAFKDGTTSAAQFNEPADVKIAKDGSIIVLDSGNQLVRKIKNGTVTTIAGTREGVVTGTTYAKGGFKDGSTANFNFPKGMFVADNGLIFIADTWNHRIRAIKPDGNVITITGTGIPGRMSGPLSKVMLNGPVGVLYSAGTLYISDMWNNSIRTIPVNLDNPPRTLDKSELIDGIKFDPVSPDKIQVWIDKKKVDFPDVQPYIDASGKTFVPIRFICSKWGADVQWVDSAKQVKVTKGTYTRSLTFGKDPVVNKDGRTAIHIRNLAESMGFYVEWIPEYRAVVISTGQ